MPTGAKVNKLTVRGVKRTAPSQTGFADGAFADLIQAAPRPGASIDLSADRAQAGDHQIACHADDVVELRLEGDLRIYTSVERLQRDVIPPAQSRGATAGELVVPRRIRFDSQHSRGVEEVLVEAVELLDLKGKLVEKLSGAASRGGAKLIAGLLEDRLIGSGGLFTLEQIRAATQASQGDAKARPEPVDPGQIDAGRPVLLFIHGTASSTDGSFSDLWKGGGGELWAELQALYGDNIFGFEHRTLTQSPIRNALDLAGSLPKGCRLHLVSHSRGGLVGELLCRGQFGDGRDPFTADDLQLFEPDGNTYLERIVELGADEADYRQHRADLADLNETLKEAELKVERFVRVACPARGTTLASGRLDLYLSALLNLIGLIPPLRVSGVYDFIKAFVLAVAKERTRPEAIPGLEAQMPGSPFIAMLNGARETTAAHLAVIAGDIEPRGILKKIAMFLVDRFYASDHDLVVNTPSMDGGGRRPRPIPILPRQGEDVHHFSYFAKGPSRRGLLAALQSPETPPGFQLRSPRPVTIARSLPRERKAGEVPVVFLLPGISGSHIEIDGNRIWVDVFDLIRGKFPDLHIDAQGVRAEALVASAYGKLADFLGQSHEVIPFPYDWRRSILEAAKTLAGQVDERLRNTDQPVRIIAHSMGGLVTRAMMATEPGVWNRMRQRQGSRILMLGTPNSGSHSIARLFADQDKLIKWLAVADLRHDSYELLDVLRRFPGVLELLPVTEGLGFYGNSEWKKFASVLGSRWPKPLVDDLREARRTWTRLQEAPLDPVHVFYIAGRADETPVEVKVEEGRIRFFATARGDGRVPWEGGIPEGLKHWYVDAVHGDLPGHEPAFEGMLQILKNGDTRLLATRPPIARGVDDRKEMLEDSVELQPDAAMLEAAALGSAAPYGRPRREAEVPAIDLSVCHGNLRFASAPVMVSHYKDDTIVSAEAQLDRQLDGRLSEIYRLGLYPGPLMTNEVLLNDDERNRFPGAVVVGLGEVGELTAGALTRTYRDALLRYALAVRQRRSFEGKPIRLVSVLIGTGSGGVSLEDAIAAMLRAAVQANRLLAGPANNVDRIIAELQFVELYEDVAVKAQRRLQEIAGSVEFKGAVRVTDLMVQGDGGRTRVYYGEDEAWWQRLRIESTDDGGLKYTALTQRARAEMRTLPTQRQSVEPFLRAATASTSTDTEAGRVLFELLIPHEFKSYAQDRRNLVLVLDKASAAYPWELLQYEGRDGNQALALQAGMIRQLATSDFARPNLCTNGRALVIGDPQYGSPEFPALPGARKEAQNVHGLLGQVFGEAAELLDNPSGPEILSRLMVNRYQVLHLAGHGVFDYELPDDSVDGEAAKRTTTKKVSGMVIGPNHLLTPVELRQMPATPELVFINCCHLGNTEDHRQKSLDQPHRFAANLATQLIDQGVRVVIAAGWAVDDLAAQTFARRFYEQMLAGASFGDAVSEARRETRDRHGGSNTWGAYQCYGDQGYRLETRRSGAGGGRERPRVSLAEFIADVRNIAEDAKTAEEKEFDWLRGSLDRIEKELPEKWSSEGELHAAFGKAWGELDRFQRAIAAYDKAVFGEDGRASIRAEEQRANLLARLAVEKAEASAKLRQAEGTRDTNRRFRDARGLINNATRRLAMLNKDFGPTVERLALLGSAHKRGALVCALAEDGKEKIIAELEKAAESYRQSYGQALEVKGETYPYPLLNWLTALWLMRELGSGVKLPDGFEDYLREADEATPVPELSREFFWNAIVRTECELLRALEQDRLPVHREHICSEYRKVRQFAASPRQFRSVMEHLGFLRDLLRLSPSKRSAREIARLIDQLSGA